MTSYVAKKLKSKNGFGTIKSGGNRIKCSYCSGGTQAYRDRCSKCRGTGYSLNKKTPIKYLSLNGNNSSGFNGKKNNFGETYGSNTIICIWWAHNNGLNCLELKEGFVDGETINHFSSAHILNDIYKNGAFFVRILKE